MHEHIEHQCQSHRERDSTPKVIHNRAWGEAIAGISSSPDRSFPVGRSDIYVGRGDATRVIPWG